MAFEEFCDSYLFQSLDADRLEDNMRAYGLLPKAAIPSKTPAAILLKASN